MALTLTAGQGGHIILAFCPFLYDSPSLHVVKALIYCVLLVPPSISNGHISACKTPQKIIRAPLESPHAQLSNGARMIF